MNMKRLTLLALALVFLLPAVSCSTSPQITGHWIDTSSPPVHMYDAENDTYVALSDTYTFEADGTGQRFFTGMTLSIEYQIDGNKLTLTTFGVDPDGPRVEVFWFVLDGDTLTLKDHEQDVYPAVVLKRG